MTNIANSSKYKKCVCIRKRCRINGFSLQNRYYFIADDEIRESVGFKNVSLGNVIPASYKGTDMPFVSAADKAMLEKYKIDAFEVTCLLLSFVLFV